MKRTVFLLGVSETIVSNTMNSLSMYYDFVRPELTRRTKLPRPEAGELQVVLIYLNELSEMNMQLFASILASGKRYANDVATPAVIVGSQEECAMFRKYVNYYRFKELIRPTTMVRINETISNYFEECLKDPVMTEVPDVPDEDSAATRPSINRGAKKQILVVDDDARLLRLMQTYLQEKYRVNVVASGTAAIKFLGKQIPDLILLDNVMPVISGQKVLEMIRASEETKNIPVVFLTGITSKETVVSCLALNPQGYLVKPIAKDMLLSKVAEVIGE